MNWKEASRDGNWGLCPHRFEWKSCVLRVVLVVSLVTQRWQLRCGLMVLNRACLISSSFLGPDNSVTSKSTRMTATAFALAEHNV